MASSEHELTHFDSQLLLLIVALAPMFRAIAPEAEAEAPAVGTPLNVFLEGRIEGSGGVGGGDDGAEDDEGARSLQGSHLAVCKNGRRCAGLNSPIEIDDDPARDAAPEIPAVDDPAVEPWASTDSNPTARGGGGGLDEEYGLEGNREWLPAAAAVAARA